MFGNDWICTYNNLLYDLKLYQYLIKKAVNAEINIFFFILTSYFNKVKF